MRKNRKRGSVWDSVPLEELAAEQGVRPIKDLNEIDRLWPVDDDPDALMEFILSERAARRGLSRRKKKTA
jgi:hypothetical protein